MHIMETHKIRYTSYLSNKGHSDLAQLHRKSSHHFTFCGDSILVMQNFVKFPGGFGVPIIIGVPIIDSYDFCFYKIFYVPQ